MYLLLHFHTYVTLRWCIFSCTSTHTSCRAKFSISMVVIRICHFVRWNAQKWVKLVKHYVVLCSLKHIDMMQKCEKLQEIEIGHWYYECGSYTTARPSYQRRYLYPPLFSACHGSFMPSHWYIAALRAWARATHRDSGGVFGGWCICICICAKWSIYGEIHIESYRYMIIYVYM